MSGTMYSRTQQRHTPEDQNLQQSRCENVSLANTENITVIFKNNYDHKFNNGINSVRRYLNTNLYAR